MPPPEWQTPWTRSEQLDRRRKPSATEKKLTAVSEELDRVQTGFRQALDRAYDAQAGAPRAASYSSDNANGADLWCFEHQRHVGTVLTPKGDPRPGTCRAVGLNCDGVPDLERSDPTGTAGCEPDVAAADLAAVQRDLNALTVIAKRLTYFTSKYSPRSAYSAELRQVERENDPGCIYCAKVPGPNGQPAWSPVHISSDCKGNLPHPVSVCQWHYKRVLATGRPPTDAETRDYLMGKMLRGAAS